MSRTGRAATGWIALVAALLSPAAAHALGTCGTGGPTGRHVNVKFAPSEYWVWAPAADPMKAYPIVFAFHGDEKTPEVSQRYFWDPVWQKEPTFIVITPRAAYGGGSWYMAQSMNEAWMDTMLAEVFAKYNVDIDRIYATGDSGGSEFLSSYGIKRQKQFAAIQWSCGGGARGYAGPPRDDCKLKARFVISTSDFLFKGAKSLHDLLVSKGHDSTFVEQSCSGHCCDKGTEYGAGAWTFMKKHTHCTGGDTGPGCGMIGDLPGAVGPKPEPPPADGGMGGAGPDGGGGAGGGGAVGDGGAGAGGGGSGGAAGQGGNGGAAGGSPGQVGGSGCACRSAGSASTPMALATLGVAILFGRRRRRSGR